MIGLKKGAAEFHKHDPLWMLEAERTISRLKDIFKDCACDIQHIGSTAVKKIKARPVIDIAVGVADLKCGQIPENELRHNGFIFNKAQSNDNRLIFFKSVYSEKEKMYVKTHNIYVVAYNGRLWLDYIIFRDCLNINEYIAYEYESVKLTLNGKYKYAMPSYIKAKSDFIRRTVDDNFYAMMLGRTINIEPDAGYAAVRPETGGGAYPVAWGKADLPKNNDIYIIGRERLECGGNFTGRLIAYIRDKGGAAGIWIAAKEGDVFYKPEILEALSYRNRAGIAPADTGIVCLYEKSCGAVLYARDGEDIKFLLVRGIRNRNGSLKSHGFPKGHIERGETEAETALREIYEETSLNVTLKPDFKEECEYHMNGNIQKKVVYFLAEFNIGDEYKIRDSNEITEQRLTGREEADRMLRYPRDREILRKAYEKIIKTDRINKQ